RIEARVRGGWVDASAPLAAIPVDDPRPSACRTELPADRPYITASHRRHTAQLVICCRVMRDGHRGPRGAVRVEEDRLIRATARLSADAHRPEIVGPAPANPGQRVGIATRVRAGDRLPVSTIPMHNQGL